jgi:hypothetical protein
MGDGGGMNWKRSTRCESGSCVEVAATEDHVYVRNSSSPDGPYLRLTHHEWKLFLDSLKSSVRHE